MFAFFEDEQKTRLVDTIKKKRIIKLPNMDRTLMCISPFSFILVKILL